MVRAGARGTRILRRRCGSAPEASAIGSRGQGFEAYSSPVSDDDVDELAGDPEAEALKPRYSKNVLIAAVVVGALFGLALAGASLVFDRYMPRAGATPPDAGPPEVPTLVEPDAGPAAEAPWLRE